MNCTRPFCFLNRCMLCRKYAGGGNRSDENPIISPRRTWIPTVNTLSPCSTRRRYAAAGLVIFDLNRNACWTAAFTGWAAKYLKEHGNPVNRVSLLSQPAPLVSLQSTTSPRWLTNFSCIPCWRAGGQALGNGLQAQGASTTRFSSYLIYISRGTAASVLLYLLLRNIAQLYKTLAWAWAHPTKIGASTSENSLASHRTAWCADAMPRPREPRTRIRLWHSGQSHALTSERASAAKKSQPREIGRACGECAHLISEAPRSAADALWTANANELPDSAAAVAPSVEHGRCWPRSGQTSASADVHEARIRITCGLYCKRVMRRHGGSFLGQALRHSFVNLGESRGGSVWRGERLTPLRHGDTDSCCISVNTESKPARENRKSTLHLRPRGGRPAAACSSVTYAGRSRIKKRARHAAVMLAGSAPPVCVFVLGGALAGYLATGYLVGRVVGHALPRISLLLAWLHCVWPCTCHRRLLKPSHNCRSIRTQMGPPGPVCVFTCSCRAAAGQPRHWQLPIRSGSRSSTAILAYYCQ